MTVAIERTSMFATALILLSIATTACADTSVPAFLGEASNGNHGRVLASSLQGLSHPDLQLRTGVSPAFEPEILEVEPVLGPDDATLDGTTFGLLGDAAHLGWPIAASAGQSLIVKFVRSPYHWNPCGQGESVTPEGQACPSQSYRSSSNVLRSIDAGDTWEPWAYTLDVFAQGASFDLRTLPTPAPVSPLPYIHPELHDNFFGAADTNDFTCPREVYRLNMAAIGRLNEDRIVTLGRDGTFVYDDVSGDWERWPSRFTTSSNASTKIGLGPHILTHRGTLYAFGHVHRPCVPGDLPMSDKLAVIYSTDDASRWQVKLLTLPGLSSSLVEPAAVVHDEHLILFARNFERISGGGSQWNYVLAIVDLKGRRIEDLEGEDLQIRVTNVPTPNLRAPRDRNGFGPFSQDTASLTFNDCTQRFEVVVTNRNGGGPGRVHHDGMGLQLWSIDAGRLLDGSVSWRFEATLLEREHRTLLDDGSKWYDGMHPGGAVVLGEGCSATQHLFIYSGRGTFARGPKGHALPATSLFRVSRTMNTPLLASRQRARWDDSFSSAFETDEGVVTGSVDDLFLLADLNADGRSDLVQLWDHAGKLGVVTHLAQANGSFVRGWSNSGGSSRDLGDATALRFVSMDVDGDRRSDVVQLWDNGGHLGVVTLRAEADGSLRRAWSNSGGSTRDLGGSAAITFLPVDANGDGHGDLVQLWSYGGKLGLVTLLGRSDGSFVRSWTNNGGKTRDLGGASAIDFLTMDVDGDGRTDIVQLWDRAGKLGLVTLKASGEGVYARAYSNSGGVARDLGGSPALQFTVDDSGHAPRIIQLWSSAGKLGMSILQGHEDGSFTRGWSNSGGAVRDLGGSSAFRFLSGDMDGDGCSDLLQLWSHQGRLGAVLLAGQPDGSFARAASNSGGASVDLGSSKVLAAGLRGVDDEDGLDALLVQHASTSGLHIQVVRAH